MNNSTVGPGSLRQRTNLLKRIERKQGGHVILIRRRFECIVLQDNNTDIVRDMTKSCMGSSVSLRMIIGGFGTHSPVLAKPANMSNK